MKLSNEQINEIAASVEGRCGHDWSGVEKVKVSVFDHDTGDNFYETHELSKCIHCGAYENGSDWPSVPDFCTDLNAAQRLVKEVGRSRRGRYELSGAVGYLLFGERDYPSDTDIADALLLPAKTITLAALVAAGKISIEDAK